jgi:dTDP-4-dehydrorhamnose 3,5-epimerase
MDGIEGVILTPLKVIAHPKGDILHALKKSEPTFTDFGEAYFSKINKGEIKGWKRHTFMTLNLIVPAGDIRFVMYDDRPESVNQFSFNQVKIGQHNYCRLTVPPMIWVAFQGIGDVNLLLNIASIEHEHLEAENKNLAEIKFQW